METTLLSDRRWDSDTRGTGIGDGGWLAPEMTAALAALAEPGWVAEDPDAHLLPHIERACAAPSSPWTLVATKLRGTVYTVDLDWRPADPSWRRLHQDTFALIGAIAEPATFVRQQKSEHGLEYHVSTGVPAGDGPFKAHGHLLRLRIGGDRVARLIDATHPDPPEADDDPTT